MTCDRCSDIHQGQLLGQVSKPCECDCHNCSGSGTNPFTPQIPPFYPLTNTPLCCCPCTRGENYAGDCFCNCHKGLIIWTGGSDIYISCDDKQC